ncbi:Ribosomal S13S15 domain protein [Methanosalsum zhilinae DSM 4017]|uniref:Small ribosomal subunit protein uS15 n=1 Tax=Methanosalsum zhilinae (strain DSM 4017 / NBRC 107636 / OCM 62 / WeN5) TaxID=679901 RepID=F7XNQ3_METZD|nr:30S ribosomal protein S15 [Methanosalsum zhilinae]AEH61254.1 Ribosomal S13S15 domain protein [Methanosalsum zhilinae DSM 4017]
MAKMHTRKKGKSMATRPYRTEAPAWSLTDKDEITKIIMDLWNQGYSTSKIGMILRDKYGVPDSKLVTDKKITQVLEENGADFPLPEDLQNLIVKAIRMRKHLAINNHDVHNKRSLQNTESKIRRLVKYYKSTKVLPKDWKYKPSTAEMLITR